MTARSRYRGLIKKRLLPFILSREDVESGEPIFSDSRKVGEIRSVVENKAMGIISLEVLKNGLPLATSNGCILTHFHNNHR